ncbi:PP2C family protein-serine/threonine phosphatase [Nocardioides piscis]|uniref:Serine/threonine-protein phosphatase n=1 Tax=Nocardioides piscis TaxID=2714938 RepID=A0A6G7YIK9_9ACTN|nr:PP2C family protein-serine/threonine phosphatase [Nocardioides piscis]QIK76569.1 serine/threonine-protein phosphatase [Nocardioides piscis]
MASGLTRVWTAMSAYVDARVASWRTGSHGSQAYVLGVFLVGVAACFAVAWTTNMMPFAVWFVWLILGVLVLRFAPLALLSIVIWLAAVLTSDHAGELNGTRIAAIIMLVLSMGLVIHQSRGHRSGLPVALSEQLLANLRDRLQAQGVIPELPEGWRSQSTMLTAHGARYAGDFLVADHSDGRHLEMVLVDVCGKGVAVGPQALQFAGALGGLIGAMPPQELMGAANAFLLRQNSEESFATAVHLLLDLRSGDFVVTSAGHPPALHWRPREQEWVLDRARGMALGVVEDADFECSTGQLAPGEALMFYTDGVVEARGRDVDAGIEWLMGAAKEAVEPGFVGAPERILRHIPRGQDDRAVLIIERIDAEAEALREAARRPASRWGFPPRVPSSRS